MDVNKPPVHKCNSDPTRGSLAAAAAAASPRKCVLTLDGYSYVIVASPPDRRSLSGQPLPVAGVAGLAVAGAGPGGGGGGAGQYDDDQPAPATPDQAGTPPPDRNGQLAQQGSLTIVRRSSTKKAVNNTPVGPTVIRGGAPGPPGAPPDDSLAGDLESLDLTTECLPAVDTPDACDKAAFRLRCLLRQLQLGQVSADLLQSNLLYAARVLEAVFIDETKDRADEGPGRPGHLSERTTSGESKPVQRRRLRRPVWARLSKAPICLHTP